MLSLASSSPVPAVEQSGQESSISVQDLPPTYLATETTIRSSLAPEGSAADLAIPSRNKTWYIPYGEVVILVSVEQHHVPQPR